MKETAFLLAVDGVVGGIEVEDEFLRGRGVRGDEGLDQDGGHTGQVGAGEAVLQATKGGRAGERIGFLLAGLEAAVGEGLKEGVVTEGLVVVEILVSGGQSEDALGQEGALVVLDKPGTARVEDGGVEGVDQTETAVDFA